MSALEVDDQTSEIAKLRLPAARAALRKTPFYRKLYVQVLIAVALGIVGVVVKGLLYLLIIGIVVFVVALILVGLLMYLRPGKRPAR